MQMALLTAGITRMRERLDEWKENPSDHRDAIETIEKRYKPHSMIQSLMEDFPEIVQA